MATEKTNRVFDVELNHSIREIVIRVIDGSKPNLVFHLDRMHEACQTAAMMLGSKNTIVDTAAKSQGTPMVEKYDAMAARIAHLESGSDQWAVRAARAGASEDNLLIAALMEVLGQNDRAKVAAAVKSWSPDKRAAVRLRDDMKIVLDRMTAEAAGDVDTDELLSEII